MISKFHAQQVCGVVCPGGPRTAFELVTTLNHPTAGETTAISK